MCACEFCKCVCISSSFLLNVYVCYSDNGNRSPADMSSQTGKAHNSDERFLMWRGLSLGFCKTADCMTHSLIQYFQTLSFQLPFSDNSIHAWASLPSSQYMTLMQWDVSYLRVQEIFWVQCILSSKAILLICTKRLILTIGQVHSINIKTWLSGYIITLKCYTDTIA